MITEIKRVASLSSTDIQACIRKSEPIIATEMTRSWKASKLWSFEFLMERYGADRVAMSDGRFQPLAELPLAHCLHIMQNMDLGNTYEHRGATPYIQDWVLLDIHPELLEDVELPEWFINWERHWRKVTRPRTPYQDVVALAGPTGATTYLHRDRRLTHAWLAQLVGRKRWTIFPPEQYRLLHKENLEEGAHPFVNIHDPDLERFPGFKNATPIEFVLHPGELIFVPSGWLHQVTSLDATISLSGNFVNGSNIGAFVREAWADRVQNRKDQEPLPAALVKECQKLATHLGGQVTHQGAKSIVKSRWNGRDLRVSMSRGGTSWTLGNYQHGRKYTSFCVDRRTDLARLGLGASGQEAARELAALSPRNEFRLVAGLSQANVVLYGRVTEDLPSTTTRLLAALEKLTESLAPEVEDVNGASELAVDE